ncbi:MAG TPA: bile acid:sodium symporter family protein [Brumimicrobium sp.]|nr:bile acid:sodium symporter family protein [Brumimicrobium sp.]
MKIDLFVVAIIASILTAYFFPWFGTEESPINLTLISSWGVSLIFFFYGLKLNKDDLRNGLQNWRLHLAVQGSTFLIFPLIVLLFYPLLRNTSYEVLWLSFLFMATLPSTVSSSVVMVSMAKGNVPGAIFNASISGIIGILITPLWMSPFIQEIHFDYNFSAIYTNLLLQILFPLVLGLTFRKFLGAFARKYTHQLSLFDKTVILLIIYSSFAKSFEDNVFKNIHYLELISIGAVVVLLFYLVYGFTGWISVRLNFSREDKITAQFCGTKKSLVHGTVFSQALFGQTSILGIILLPLMVFHALQILIISVIATRIGKEKPL